MNQGFTDIWADYTTRLDHMQQRFDGFQQEWHDWRAQYQPPEPPQHSFYETPYSPFPSEYYPNYYGTPTYPPVEDDNDQPQGPDSP